MKTRNLFNVQTEMFVTTKLVNNRFSLINDNGQYVDRRVIAGRNVGRKVVGGNKRKANLVLDQGLNCMARKSGVTNCPGTSPAGCFTNLVVGSGTNPTTIASGAITFTQAGTTITASGGFFTAAMAGCIFKYGTGSGGAEYYITVFTNSTTVTVDTSATVGTPEVATVYFVQQVGLQTLFTPTGTKTYQTNAGDCQSTYSGAIVTHKRTFIIPQQAGSYTVNEIGYGSNVVTSNANVVVGRIVLASSDVVGTSNFYLVVLELNVTYSPAAPTAVGDVGTNINTAGNAMMETFVGVNTVASTGLVSSTVNQVLDGTATATLKFATASYTQNSAIDTIGTPAWTTITIGTAAATYLAASRGIMQWSFNSSVSTSGQSLTGMGMTFTSSAFAQFDIKFTTPQTAPTGTFQPVSLFQIVYGRILTN